MSFYTLGWFKAHFLRGKNNTIRSGTFTLNGATPVSVSNINWTATSVISFGLKTVGGTVSPNGPAQTTVTPGTGFTVAGTAGDTSTYTYFIIETQ